MFNSSKIFTYFIGLIIMNPVMKTNRFSQLYKNVQILIILITLVSQGQTQNRGAYSFAAPKAISLKVNSSGQGYSGAFAGGVGGISFEKTAIVAQGFQINQLKISYNKLQADGKRMELEINGKSINTNLYDWQLIPIVKYANSNSTACFTYFGELENKALADTIKKYDGHILNYHPDFENTLLGWRLADMDLMMMYNFTSDLPKVNGKYILGKGESVPDTISNNNGGYYFQQYLNSVVNDLGHMYQSYIISDYSRNIVIKLQNDSLELSGYPYYYCWRLRKFSPGFDIQKVADSISDSYTLLVKKQLENYPGINVRRLYIDSLIVLSDLYPDSFPFYESGTFIDLVGISSSDEKRRFLENFSTENLITMCIVVSAYMIANDIQMLKELSDRMSARPQMLEACNPEVWKATTNTMRYAAFYRFIKANYPEQWKRFYNQVLVLEPVPEVITPTVLYETKNKKIRDALRRY
jgi:hypothetical protein